MKNQKKSAVYIIPGFTENTNQKPYHDIGEHFLSKNINPIYVDISWNIPAEFTAMPMYVKEFENVYDKTHKEYDEIHLLGFSFGAMIACIAASTIYPQTLILCSLAPFFKEDIEKFKQRKEFNLARLQIASTEEYSFSAIAEKIPSKTFIIYGEKEHRNIISRATTATMLLKYSHLVVGKNAGHCISQPEYLETVKNVIDTFYMFSVADKSMHD